MTKLIEMLPKYYDSSRVVDNIMAREDGVFDQLDVDRVDVLNQFLVDTATWGLKYWERVCNIPTDETKPYSQRRSLIKSRLRGYGTVTVAFIKSVSESFINGQCDVMVDSPNFSVNIKFIGARGRPDNQTDIEQALRDIIPAHLGITYTFSYVSWGEVNEQTWSQVQVKTWDQLERSFLT